MKIAILGTGLAAKLHTNTLKAIAPDVERCYASRDAARAEAARAGTPVSVKVYPETGTREEQGHCFGGAGGMHIWAADAQAFFQAHMPAD